MEQTVLKVQAPRTALMTLLDSFLGKQILYLHAPAGFGKTVSALLWLEHRGAPAKLEPSWISLDEHDNKTSEFCKRFVFALLAFQPENAVLRELASHPVFATAPVEFTLQALSAFTGWQTPSVLVLDDLHVIKNEELLNLLPALFKRLPESCTVLLLSRAAPPDVFSGMVAKGELAVVDAEALQFTSEEIKIFFGMNGRFVSSAQADEIFARTGGWAIGLRALLLSEEKSYGIDLTGKYLENFLRAHVWERWDDRTKSFMTLVSVANELTPELCEWLTAGEKTLKGASGADILSGLTRENAFLRETGRGTYRFHDLFREFLLHMLKKNGKRAAAAQWNRAGDYYYGREDYFRAVEYYQKGENGNGVAKALYGMYDYNSPYASIEDTLSAIHISVNDTLVDKHPFLLEVQAWAAYVEGRAEDLERFLDTYFRLFPKIVLQSPRSAIILMLLQCMDPRINFADALKTLRLVPFKGSLRAFTPSITQNLPLLHRSCRDFSDVVFDTDKILALFEKTMGVVIGAESAVIQACIYAGLNYERGYIDEAREHALAAHSSIPDGGSAEIKFCAMMILASVLFADGQSAEANKILDMVNDMIERDRAFYLKPNLGAYLFRRKLANGDKDAAAEWLKNHRGNLYDNLSFYKSYQHFTTARAHIVMGDYSHAILLLKKLLQLCERYRRPLDVIEIRVLLAVAYWKKGRSGNFIALDYLEQAVLTAHTYGYTQVFANEGAELLNMLQRLQKRSVQKEYAGGIPSEFVKTLYIAAVSEAKRTKGLTGGRTPSNLTFTDKQKAVMRLMCEGCSRNAIAERMGLKPSGVKNHIELIYRKLDVSTGIEAVLKIKELGVLARSPEKP
ncbi:MAG: LuxR C-terminal-related transcriptional regulator [Oscillospiraceae bacterium]|nr:LuxR C-terminal-related transcriptional regulator [Oscillospiraceae bacterium]